MVLKKRWAKIFGIVLLVALAVVGVSVTGAALAKDRAAQSTATYDAPLPTEKPLSPVALWIGDSYTEGTGANGFGNSYASIVSRKLGYIPFADAQGGTGYVADGKNNTKTNVPVPDRLDKVRVRPNLVVLDVGRNDGAADFTKTVKPAAQTYINEVRAKWPEAKIVFLVPYYIQTLGPFRTFQSFYAEEAQRVGAYVVDPVGEGWFKGQEMPPLIYTDGIHPSQKGHAFIASKMLARFDELGLRGSSSSD